MTIDWDIGEQGQPPTTEALPEPRKLATIPVLSPHMARLLAIYAIEGNP
jgi:hypothetical protein